MLRHLDCLKGSIFALATLSFPVGGWAKGVESIQVPTGFVVEQVAGPPQTERPLMGGFDEQGRLYLAESAGINLEAKDLLEKTPNFVRRLEDADGDGRFEKSTVFADKMTFPMGALPYRGSVYVASPPYIWRLTDTNDDGIADKRDIFVGKFGFIGNAADIHGCFLGPSGRIYWCDGRHGHEFLDENGKIVSKGKAARIFSCRLDGSNVLAHCGGGMDNPVEVDFSPQGEMLGVVNLFYQKRGDCLVHWLWGGVYPRTDQPLQIAEFKRTGDLLGPVHDFGHVAVSGMLRYRGQQFGKPFEGDLAKANYFVCEFNTHKLVRVIVERAGSSFSARVEDFLTSSDPDFHPTDVIEDADGSLLLVDTGGWFRNGCPSSVVAKPEITGGIYRIRKVDGPEPKDPRGLKLAWDDAKPEDLINRLDDPRSAVAERAIDTLARRGDEAVNPLLASLQSPTTPKASIHAVWALARIGTPSAVFAIVQSGLPLHSETRQAAIVALQTADIPERMLPIVFAELYKALRDDPPQVKREAAVALGRLNQPEAVPILLEQLSGAGFDRSLEHAVIYALIELNDPVRTKAGLSHSSTNVRRGALIALDQMPAGDLARDDVAPLLDTGDAALQEAALEIVAKHPAWTDEIRGLVRQWLSADSLDESRSSILRGVLVAFGGDEKTQALVGTLLGENLKPFARKLLLDVVAQSDVPGLPASWKAGLERAVGDSDDEIALAALFASAKHPALADVVSRLAGDEMRGHSLRAAAAATLARMGLPIDEGCYALLCSQLSTSEAPLERRAAAEALGSAALSTPQKRKLIDAVRAAGPVELAALIRAFERTPADPALGQPLVDALKASKGLVSLSADRIAEVLSAYPEAVREAGKGLVASLASDREVRLKFAGEVESRLAAADPARGKDLFLGTKAACASCHAVAGQGGKIGPDLTKIGSIREPRVLVESIVFPSASLARGFESYSILCGDGRVMNGLISRESTDAVWLRTEARSEVRVPRNDIEEISPSARSIMPEGLDRLLTKEELADLVAYLATLK